MDITKHGIKNRAFTIGSSRTHADLVDNNVRGIENCNPAIVVNSGRKNLIRSTQSGCDAGEKEIMLTGQQEHTRGDGHQT